MKKEISAKAQRRLAVVKAALQVIQTPTRDSLTNFEQVANDARLPDVVFCLAAIAAGGNNGTSKSIANELQQEINTLEKT